MGYYMGDFYMRGGRLRAMGDPGFFSFLGGAAKSIAGMIPGIGPVAGPLAGKIANVVGIAQKVRGAIGGGARQASGAIVKAVSEHPVLTAAGAASSIGAAAAAIHHRGSMAAAGMGATARVHVGGRRHRRMNACNPKALRRAIRRTHAFAKLAMKTIHLVHPKKHATFGGFRKKRRKK